MLEIVETFYKECVTKNRKTRKYYKCKCKCGKIVTVRCDRINRKNQTCGCEGKKIGGAKRPVGEAYIYANFLHYKKAAERTKKDFLITEDDFRSFIFQNCFYCGQEPKCVNALLTKRLNGSVPMSGLDRIDSDVGYLKENLVSCCKVCNYYKLENSIDIFLNKAFKIYNYSKKTHEDIPPIIFEESSSFKVLENRISYLAKYRGLAFELTSEEVWNLIYKDCFYCGQSYKDSKRNYNKKEYYANGIDRKDSNIGYINTNCVTCCSFCNYAKHVLSVDEFLAHTKKIVEHQIKQNFKFREESDG